MPRCQSRPSDARRGSGRAAGSLSPVPWGTGPGGAPSVSARIVAAGAAAPALGVAPTRDWRKGASGAGGGRAAVPLARDCARGASRSEAGRPPSRWSGEGDAGAGLGPFAVGRPARGLRGPGEEGPGGRRWPGSPWAGNVGEGPQPPQGSGGESLQVDLETRGSQRRASPGHAGRRDGPKGCGTWAWMEGPGH